MRLRDRLRLYIITDRRLKDEVSSVKAALEAGATAIQLRIKDAPSREMYNIGREIRRLTRDYDALYIVDDRLDIALAVDADGVQLGPEDLPIDVARELAPNLIIGASIYSLEEALKAEEMGADYLGAGAIYPSPSKPDAKVLGIEGLKEVVSKVSIPVVAIGGINHDNAADVIRAGADGVAVISAVMAADDVYQATLSLKEIIDKVFREVGGPD